MPSGTCLRMSALSAALLIFNFQFSLLFFHISVARQQQHCGVLYAISENPTSDVAKNWVGTFPVRNVHPRGKTELILTNFRQFVIIAELWRPEVTRSGNFVSNFCVFLEKRPFTVNCQNSVSKVFTASSIDVVAFKCKICPMGNQWYRALFTWPKKTKLAPYGTDGRLFATDVSAKFRHKN